MSKFLLVSEFEPYHYFIDTKILNKPFYINVDHIRLIRPYDIDIHAAIKYNPATKKETKIIPEGSLGTLYVNMNGDQWGYHLDQESSKKVLEAISR